MFSTLLAEAMEAPLSEMVINMTGLSSYSLQGTALGDLMLAPDSSGEWVLKKGTQEIARFPKGDISFSKVRKHIDKLAAEQPSDEFLFTTVMQAKAWIAMKSKEYGSKSKLLSSPEYARAYPLIKKINDEAAAKEKAARGSAGESAMRDAGLTYGDRVEQQFQTFIGSVTKVRGELMKRGGVPTVRLDDDSREMMQGRARFVPWHKGFRKI